MIQIKCRLSIQLALFDLSLWKEKVARRVIASPVLLLFLSKNIWECLLVVLHPDLFKHGKVDEEIAALAESRGHSLVKSCHLDAHTMIGAVVEHRHEVAIPADQHDTVNRSTIHKTHDIHTQVKVEIGLFRTTRESFIVLRSDTIA